MLKRVLSKMLLHSSMMLLLIFSNVLYAIDVVDVIIPSLTTDFYVAAPQKEGILLRKGYRDHELPEPFNPNSIVRFTSLVPPGATSITLNATSNDWYGNGPGSQLVFGIFAEDPGTELCAEGQTVKCIPLEELAPYTGSSGLSILRSDTSFKSDEPFYAYTVHYNPSNSTVFYFKSYNIDMVVRDTELYSEWRANRSWTGGDGNKEGVEEKLVVKPLPPPVKDSCTTTAHNEVCYSLSSNILHIPKTIIVDGNLSDYCDIELTGFTSPSGLQFVLSKGAPCATE